MNIVFSVFWIPQHLAERLLTDRSHIGSVQHGSTYGSVGILGHCWCHEMPRVFQLGPRLGEGGSLGAGHLPGCHGGDQGTCCGQWSWNLAWSTQRWHLFPFEGANPNKNMGLGGVGRIRNCWEWVGIICQFQGCSEFANWCNVSLTRFSHYINLITINYYLRIWISGRFVGVGPAACDRQPSLHRQVDLHLHRLQSHQTHLRHPCLLRIADLFGEGFFDELLQCA